LKKEFLTILAPAAPFVTDELWHMLGFGEENDTIHTQKWPEWVEKDLEKDTVEIVVQIKGKIRGRISVPADASRESIEQMALGLEKVQDYLKGAVPKRVIVVPGRLVNIIG